MDWALQWIGHLSSTSSINEECVKDTRIQVMNYVRASRGFENYKCITTKQEKCVCFFFGVVGRGCQGKTESSNLYILLASHLSLENTRIHF